MTINFDFDNLKEKAKDLAQTSVAKAKELTDSAIGKGKELSEIGKLKVQNASEQESIKKAYLELGKLYYAERGAAPEAAYAALCEQISAAKAKVEYNNERIADIKAAGNLSDEDIQDAECCCTEEPCDCAPEEDACGCDCGCTGDDQAE